MAVSSDRAVGAIRDEILAGRFAPGERLAETDLAALLGMSRTPVRDALRRLAAEGLVELASNKGARVIAWTPQELDHVFRLRAHLEGFATGEAARLATAEQLDELDELARSIERHALPGPEHDLSLVPALNSSFHGLLSRIGGSASLRGALSGLVHAPVLTRTMQAFDDEAMRRSVNHHLEIVAALRAGDGEWAASVMRSHLLSARASLLSTTLATSAAASPTTTEAAGDR
jgi:DNA-binding GntR family transcriptional regulator